MAELEGTCLVRWNNITHPRPLMAVRVFLDQNMHFTSKVGTFLVSEDILTGPHTLLRSVRVMGWLWDGYGMVKVKVSSKFRLGSEQGAG